MYHKNLSRLSLTAVAVACLPLVACVDDNYDLSDIDTTAEIKVNNLVVPVNLDEITLSNVFDLDEEGNSVLKEVDGIYAVLVDGEFQSEELQVNAVTLGQPTIPATTTTISLVNGGTDINIPPVSIGKQNLTYSIDGFNTHFSYTTATVDKSIRSLSKIAVDWTITINLSVLNSGNVFESVAFRNVTLKLPAGLHTPGYPDQNGNGIIKLADVDLSDGHMTHSVAIHVDEIDLTRLSDQEFSFVPDPTYENPGSLTINGSIGVESGYVVAVTNSSISSVPSQTSLTLAPVGSAIRVTAVDGVIRYGISNFNVDPVTLNDLPDVLRQGETNIVMANPRLYLSINNPLAGYSLDANSGLTLTACREDGSREPYSLDPGESITIGHNAGIAGPYKFCLAPDPSAAGSFEGFAGATPVLYQKLGDVLSGKGLPSTIEVSFDDPHVGPGPVSGFALPNTLQPIKGDYTFYAPLNLGVNSKIVYDEITDGWSDETLDKITIQKLKVNATVYNTLPFDIVLSGYPVDVNGDQCKDAATGKLVTLGSVSVKAGATEAIVLESTGTITNLDGVRYFATAVVTKGGVTLRPDDIIRLTGIKATVSGFYLDEL